MKIGIITFHRAKNYGAMLQAYALKESLAFIESTSIIDYRCDVIEKTYYSNERGIVNKLKSMLRFFLRYQHTKQINKKNRRFAEFYSSYLKDGDVYTKDTVYFANEKYDIFISGSDQIWCTKLTNYDWNYYLIFADEKKRFSYAASFGTDEKELSENEKVLELLSKYQSILVREETAKNKLESVEELKKDVRLVCDPVFLLSKKRWEENFQLRDMPYKKTKYILVYVVSQQTHLIDFTKQLAKAKGLDVRYINLYGNISSCDKEFQDILDAGPIEFLKLVYNAEYVVTTSFHAMAFSILFNIPFFYELNKEKNNSNSRLEVLSKIFEVCDREIIGKDFISDGFIDWDFINSKIELYRQISMESLYDAIDKRKL